VVAERTTSRCGGRQTAIRSLATIR
jgi:hypothetical protein